MALRWFLATAHLWALGIGLGAVWVRGRLLSGRLDAEGLRRVFTADTWWGVAGALWLASGLWRLLGSMEKDTAYYLSNHVFLTKMALFVGLLAMEVRPMVTLIRWRKAVAAGATPDLSTAPRLARVSQAQAWIVILLVATATAMARGVGGR